MNSPQAAPTFIDLTSPQPDPQESTYLPTAEQQEDFEDLQDAYDSLWLHLEERLIMESPTDLIELLQALLMRWISPAEAVNLRPPSTVEVQRLLRLISFISRLHQDFHNVDYFRTRLENLGYKLPSRA